MTDDIKAIRDALQAGPTPGPWEWKSRNLQCFLVGAEGREIIEVAGVEGTPGDDDLIAACHPERIARLLDALELAQKDAERWRGLYRRAVNEANGLTNYVDDRPELRRAERNLTAIEAEARAIVVAMKGQA